MTTDRTLSRRGLATRIAASVAALALASTVVLGSTAVVAGATATTAARPTASVAGFVQSINDLRASLGLGGMRSSSQLDAIAQRWSERMAAAGGISHNPNLAAEVGDEGWKLLGENVGVGWDVLGLMSAFIGSPAHYANLVNPAFDFVGIGEVVMPDGRLFTTHVFMQSDAPATPAVVTPPAPKPQPAPTPAAAPAPTATTTPAPPPPPAAAPAPAPAPTPTRVAAVLDPLRTFDPA